MITIPLVLIDAAIPVSAPDRARGQIEAAGAGRQIGDDENGQDADGRDVDTAQEQCDDEKRIIGGGRQTAKRE